MSQESRGNSQYLKTTILLANVVMGLHVVGLKCGTQVEGLEVYCPPWFAILLWADNCLMAPGDQFSNWYWFDDTKVDILIKPCLISSCQYKGIGSGLWWETGVASGSIMSHMGGPSIIGRGWCLHMLKVME